MSLKFVAVTGFAYEISDSTVQATVTITGTPSAKCKAGGQGICKDEFSATVSAITVPSEGATIPDPGPYNVTFSATAEKVKADGSFVLRVGDETGDISATPQIPGTPPVSYPVTFNLKITDAGQDKVRSK
jgi:hypothetical protein